MAPRRRQAAPNAGAATPSLASLPDGLLERILGLMPRRDRHRAALVSRRWHAAAHAPAALQNCPVLLSSSTGLSSLTAWLRRHGRHVRCFRLSCFPSSSEAHLCAWEAAACLELLSGKAPLQQLSLNFGGAGIGLVVTSWCVMLRQLRSLHLCTSRPNSLRISSSLAGLTALTRLEIEGAAVLVDAAAELPPSVERLTLRDSGSAALPHQLSRLTRLSLLMLSARSCEPDGFAVLASLRQLVRLSLGCINHLPACLPQLTWLSELMLHDTGKAADAAAARAAIESALRPLTGLTSLCILGEARRCLPPASLAGLSRLQRCCLDGRIYGPVEQQGPPVGLPSGPWAANLLELGASLDVLPHSVSALQAATQLTRLVVTGSSFKCQEQDAFWKWAGSHPPLRQLQIEVDDDADLKSGTLHAICSLALSRPDLRVTTELLGESDWFYQEFALSLYN